MVNLMLRIFYHNKKHKDRTTHKSRNNNSMQGGEDPRTPTPSFPASTCQWSRRFSFRSDGEKIKAKETVLFTRPGKEHLLKPSHWPNDRLHVLWDSMPRSPGGGGRAPFKVCSVLWPDRNPKACCSLLPMIYDDGHYLLLNQNYKFSRSFWKRMISLKQWLFFFLAPNTIKLNFPISAHEIQKSFWFHCAVINEFPPKCFLDSVNFLGLLNNPE